MVERVNITNDRITLRNASNNVTFDTCRRYVRTDDCACFVVDHSVNAPRPRSTSSMGECTHGAYFMNDVINTQTCFDCCFSFPVTGTIRPELSLGYHGQAGSIGGAVTASCNPYVRIEIWECYVNDANPTICNSNTLRVCLAMGFAQINNNQGTNGRAFVMYPPGSGKVRPNCSTDIRYCYILPDGPPHGFPGVSGTYYHHTCGFWDYYSAPYFSYRCGHHCFLVRGPRKSSSGVYNSYVRVYRDEGVCGSFYTYAGGHSPICCDLPVALSFLASTGQCLPLAYTPL